jgi:hypothetical protein
MPQWKARVNIGDLHQSYQDGNLSVSDLALSVHQRLASHSYYQNDELYEYQEITDWFEDVAEDAQNGKADINDYDSVLRELYDWGDDENRLWVDTFNR